MASAGGLLSARLPSEAPLEAHLRHVRGVALARLGDLAGAAIELEAAAEAARAAEQHFEILLALDALEALVPLGGATASPARRAERDTLLATMDIVRIPSPTVVQNVMRETTHTPPTS